MVHGVAKHLSDATDMSDLERDIFRLVVTHNKLMDEQQLDQLIEQVPEPKKAIERMVRDEVVSLDIARKLLAVYKKKLEKEKIRRAQAAAEAEGTEPQTPADDQAQPIPVEGEDEAEEIDASQLEEVEDEPTAAAPASGDGFSTGVDSGSDNAAMHLEFGEALASPDTIEIDTGKRGKELIHALLDAARKCNASDIHIKADEKPVVRVAGRLRALETVDPLPPEVTNEALLACLDDEKRKHFEEHWDLDLCYDAGDLGRFRTNYMRQHRGTDGIFRVISSHVPSIEELGLPGVVAKLTQYRLGIALVTGPKGCGKTTTLAAMVDLINTTRREHIITVEDPIEFVQPCKMGHVNQREVGQHTQSFGNALRAALREAPDVIMVGEMRDLETTSLAITAAETGHLVFGTLHTPDAVRTIGRVLDVFPPKEQGQIRAMFSESLRGIVSQLLLPSIDDSGLVLAVEVLINTPAIGNMIREDRAFQIAGLMQTGKKLGMQTMDDSLIELVRSQKISPEVAIANATNPKQVQSQVGGKAQEKVTN